MIVMSTEQRRQTSYFGSLPFLTYICMQVARVCLGGDVTDIVVLKLQEQSVKFSLYQCELLYMFE